MAHFTSKSIADASKAINEAKSTLNKIDMAFTKVSSIKEWDALKGEEFSALLKARRAAEELLEILNAQVDAFVF